MHLSSLYIAAADVREAIEQNRNRASGDLESLCLFPHKCCKITCFVLARFLREVECYPEWSIRFCINGQRTPESERVQTHAWLEIGNRIVDITADQFGEQKPPVLVTADRTWHASFERSQPRSYQKMMDLGAEWSQNFDAFFEVICASLDRKPRQLEQRLASLEALFDRGGIVYLLTCIADGPDIGKRYVGLTTGPLWLREYGHMIAAEGAGGSERLYRAISEYTPFDQHFRVEEIARAATWHELQRLERQYIRQLNTHVSAGSGFNLSWGGEGQPPLRRLVCRIENEMHRRRGDLDDRIDETKRAFASRYRTKWHQLNLSQRTALLQHDAIRAEFLNLLRHEASDQLLAECTKASDPAVLHAVHEFASERPDLAGRAKDTMHRAIEKVCSSEASFVIW